MERVLSLIEHDGYLVVFFGVMMESKGVPLPGVLAQQPLTCTLRPSHPSRRFSSSSPRFVTYRSVTFN